MSYDFLANLAYSTVATAPSPPASGTSLVVASGEGVRFPDPSVNGEYNIVIWSATALATPTNAEIVRVTAKSADTLTIARTQEGTSTRTVLVGDQIALAPTVANLNQGLNPQVVTKVKAANETRVSTTPTADSSITFPIGANEVWSIRIFLRVAGTGGNPSIDLTHSIPTGAEGEASGWSSDFAQRNWIASGWETSVRHFTVGDVVYWEGVLVNGATPDDFTLVWSANATDTTNVTIEEGSKLIATRLS